MNKVLAKFSTCAMNRPGFVSVWRIRSIAEKQTLTGSIASLLASFVYSYFYILQFDLLRGGGVILVTMEVAEEGQERFAAADEWA